MPPNQTRIFNTLATTVYSEGVQQHIEGKTFVYQPDDIARLQEARHIAIA